MTRDGIYWAIQNNKLVFPPLEMTFPCSMSGRPNQTKGHMSAVHRVTPRRKARRAGTKATFGALEKHLNRF